VTTTDPTPLAEQIAREHPMNALGGCVACATGGDRPTIREEVEEYAAHIATVTERAVRERIVAQIEEFEPEDRALVHMPDWREAMYDAADIARGAADA